MKCLSSNLAVVSIYAVLLAACSSNGDSGASGSAEEGGSGWSGDGDGEGSGDGSASAGETGGDGDGDDEGDTGNVDESGSGSDESESDSGGDECADEMDTVLYLSPDDSNSMSSPVQVREEVLSGWAGLGGAKLRPWEFMNYYSFPYGAAQPGDLDIHAEMVAGEEPGSYTLQLGVTSEQVTQAERAPMSITLVVDTSGSMQGHPIEMAREMSRAIAASLKAGDTVSMVTWAVGQNVMLEGHVVSGANDSVLLDMIDAMESAGGTDLHNGLVKGYALSMEAYQPDRINRLVLISDGGANVGVTDKDLIAEHAAQSGEDGIYLVGVGVGSTGYNDDLMDTVTDLGKGASLFVNTGEEAWKMFSQNFINTMAVAAHDVQVELTLPPGFEIVKFSGEEWSPNPEEIEPQHLAPSDAMVFHQQIETCAPELVDDEATVSVRLGWKQPGTGEAKEATRSFTFAELLAAEPNLLSKGAAILALTDGLQAYRDSGDSAALLPAEVALDAALAERPDDADLLEMKSIIDTLL